jgi:hypothetical protein
MLSQTIEDVGTLEKYTLRHPVTTKVTTGVRLPSPPLFTKPDIVHLQNGLQLAMMPCKTIGDGAVPAISERGLDFP